MPILKNFGFLLSWTFASSFPIWETFHRLPEQEHTALSRGVDEIFLHNLYNNTNRCWSGGYLLCRCCIWYCRFPSDLLLSIIIAVLYCLSGISKTLHKFQWENYHYGTMDLSLGIFGRDLAPKGLSRNCSSFLLSWFYTRLNYLLFCAFFFV